MFAVLLHLQGQGGNVKIEMKNSPLPEILLNESKPVGSKSIFGSIKELV
jgi:hypothetical protein